MRRCGASYVESFGAEVYQAIQSVVCCSWTWRRIQDSEIGMVLSGGRVVACFARRSASSLPSMLVCPGTQWMVMRVPVSRSVVAVSLICRASSCPGPVVRREARRMADWLSVNIWMCRRRGRWRVSERRQASRHSCIARSSASKTSVVLFMGMAVLTSRCRPREM